MRFKTKFGSHVAIFVPWRETPISVPGEYETSDKREIEALKGSSEVSLVKEVKATEKPAAETKQVDTKAAKKK